MVKIKGWKRDEHTGNIIAWVTTKRPYLNVWIVNIFKNYANDGLWEVNIDFGVPRKIVFKTKKEALEKAYEIMRKTTNN